MCLTSAILETRSESTCKQSFMKNMHTVYRNNNMDTELAPFTICSSNFLKLHNVLWLQQYFRSFSRPTPLLRNLKHLEATQWFHRPFSRDANIHSNCDVTIMAPPSADEFLPLLLKPRKNAEKLVFWVKGSVKIFPTFSPVNYTRESIFMKKSIFVCSSSFKNIMWLVWFVCYIQMLQNSIGCRAVPGFNWLGGLSEH